MAVVCIMAVVEALCITAAVTHIVLLRMSQRICIWNMFHFTAATNAVCFLSFVNLFVRGFVEIWGGNDLFAMFAVSTIKVLVWFPAYVTSDKLRDVEFHKFLLFAICHWGQLFKKWFVVLDNEIPNFSFTTFLFGASRARATYSPLATTQKMLHPLFFRTFTSALCKFAWVTQNVESHRAEQIHDMFGLPLHGPLGRRSRCTPAVAPLCCGCRFQNIAPVPWTNSRNVGLPLHGPLGRRSRCTPAVPLVWCGCRSQKLSRMHLPACIETLSKRYSGSELGTRSKVDSSKKSMIPMIWRRKER